MVDLIEYSLLEQDAVRAHLGVQITDHNVTLLRSVSSELRVVVHSKHLSSLYHKCPLTRSGAQLLPNLDRELDVKMILEILSQLITAHLAVAVNVSLTPDSCLEPPGIPK